MSLVEMNPDRKGYRRPMIKHGVTYVWTDDSRWTDGKHVYVDHGDVMRKVNMDDENKQIMEVIRKGQEEFEKTPEFKEAQAIVEKLRKNELRREKALENFKETGKIFLKDVSGTSAEEKPRTDNTSQMNGTIAQKMEALKEEDRDEARRIREMERNIENLKRRRTENYSSSEYNNQGNSKVERNPASRTANNYKLVDLTSNDDDEDNKDQIVETKRFRHAPDGHRE